MFGVTVDPSGEWQFTYPARLIEARDGEPIHDGDTVRVDLDHGCRVSTDQSIRLLGVFAPELNQLGGPETRAFVVDWFARHAHPPTAWPLKIVTDKDRRSFNRYIGTITCMLDGASLNSDVNGWLATRNA